MTNETKSVTDLSQPHEWLTEYECATAWNLSQYPDGNGFHEEINALLTRKYGDLKRQLAEARKDSERYLNALILLRDIYDGHATAESIIDAAIRSSQTENGGAE